LVAVELLPDHTLGCRRAVAAAQVKVAGARVQELECRSWLSNDDGEVEELEKKRMALCASRLGS